MRMATVVLTSVLLLRMLLLLCLSKNSSVFQG
jgi:hypothetical protein